MPTGNVTISFFANSATNTVAYTVSGAGVDPPIVSTDVVVCPTVPGPCSITIPITYDDPSCTNLLVEGEIYCDEDDPVSFSQTVVISNPCRVFNIKCIKEDTNGNPMDCLNFNTRQTCPDCLATDPDNAIVTTYNTPLFPDGTPNTLTAIPANRIPHGAEFRFCYPENTVITRDPESFEITALEQNNDNCCYDCERRQFIITPAVYTPPVSLETFVVNIVYTACEEGCYLPKNQIFLPKLVAGEPYVFTACMVKDSWTVMATVPNIPVYTTSVIDPSCNP